MTQGSSIISRPDRRPGLYAVGDGVKNAMPADRDLFDYHFRSVKCLSGPGATWCAAGIDATQPTLNEPAVSSGRHACTGLEDNMRLDRHRLAPCNAALARRATALCAQYDRPVAAAGQARVLVGLKVA